MPLQYKRKGNVSRGEWTENDLRNAVQAHTEGMGVNEAANTYGIPKSTFKRRLKKNQLTKSNVLGPSSVLSTENEKKIVVHIIKLQKRGFTPSRLSVRKMAYNLAEQLNIRHTFNREKKMAGFGWLESFLRRNPELAIRKSEGVSQARAQGMDRDRVNRYFDLLEKVFSENGMFNKPGSIFNMDESGLQLNNRPGMVVAAKGSKNIPTITSAERIETVSVIACCSGEGVFLPPYCIMKGKNKKSEFEDGMPPGSVVKMSLKSAYVNSDIFFDWLKKHFFPRKPEGKCVLILDGHSSHCSDAEMLEYAEQHDIIIICLPSHTTHYLQPLDRAFFKSLKTFYYDECNKFIVNHQSRKLTRLQFGKILASAWNKSASVNNAISGFSSTGIIPFNKDAIPEYAFLSSNTSSTANQQLLISSIDNTSLRNDPSMSSQAVSTSFECPMSSQVASTSFHRSPSHEIAACSQEITPGKILDIVSPVPSVEKTRGVRQRSRQVAEILNSAENIKAIKNKGIGKKSTANKRQKLEKENVALKKLKKKQKDKSDTSTDSEVISLRDSPEIVEWDDNECAGCGENYKDTLSQDEWLQCTICERWSHESCTKSKNMCDRCGDTITN